MAAVRSEQVWDIIAKEAGVERDELTDDVEFADLGIDNILSKDITSKVSKILDIRLPDTLFQDYPSVEELSEHLDELCIRASNGTKSNGTNGISPKKYSTAFPGSPAVPLSFLLQGKPSPTTTNVFLFPDGSGAGMSYVKMPRIAPDVCLIGLNSGFLNKAEDFKYPIEEYAVMWIDEIRRRQPKGPYIIGGWSAGGYYCFEAAKRLIQDGEVIEKLILIDSPCRLLFEALPNEVVHVLSARNLMGDWGAKGPPQWLLNHFASTLRAVGTYMPTPMDPVHVPETYIIWSSEGVFDDLDVADTGLDLNVKVTRFLLEGKPNYGPHGWDKLVPGAKISIATMPGTHFTIVHPPNVRFLLRYALPFYDCC